MISLIICSITDCRPVLMKATSVASSGIVHELLTRDNYEGWRVVMQNYLQGQGLWDVVQTANSEVELEALEKTEIDDAKAKKFWNILSAQNSTELKAAPDIEQGAYLDVIQYRLPALSNVF